MEAHIREMFAAVDAGDAPTFLSLLTPDARFSFGNAPPVEGHHAIVALVAGMRPVMQQLRHEILEMWRVGETWIVEQRVHYLDGRGRRHNLPCTNIFRLREGLIADYRVFIDISPLAAADTAQASATAA